MGRVRTSADLGRLSVAASRPGIDPRNWLLKCIVIDTGYDPAHGLFADVQTQPDGDIETVLLGVPYAGDDFGMYWPVKKDDIVLVAFPQGDPGDGGVIISRLFSGSEKPPVELSAGDLGADGSDPTTDPTLRIKNGATMRIVGKAGASYKIELAGNATYEIVGTAGTTVKIDGDAGVELGKPATRGVARLQDSVAAKGTPGASVPGLPVELLALWATKVTAAVNTLLPGSVGLLDPDIGSVSSASSKVKAE